MLILTVKINGTLNTGDDVGRQIKRGVLVRTLFYSVVATVINELRSI